MTSSTLAQKITEIPHQDDDGTSFMDRFVAALRGAGLPVWRVSYALVTMHPELLWRTVQWSEEKGVVARDQTHARLEDDFYRKSAVAVARTQEEPVRVHLDKGDLRFPIAADLRDLGGTDYVVFGLPFANGQVGYISLATKKPGGFSDTEISDLTEVRPFVARRLELESSYYATRALLDVYLGRNAARRVMSGEVKRGKGEMIDAVIWFSDMRDFTALSDRSAPADVVQTLDGYFDAVANAIAAGGGEVLKFIGDAVLGIFAVEHGKRDGKTACHAALAAVDAAFASLGHLNDTRATAGRDAVSIGVALHCGPVMYGNIGARDRLDFTVISSAVNEASRLESLCKTLGTRVALSEPFVRTARLEQDPEVVDLGSHAAKGVRAALHVFAPRRYQTA